MGDFFDDFFNGFGESNDGAKDNAPKAAADKADNADIPTPIDDGKDVIPAANTAEEGNDNFFASADSDSVADDREEVIPTESEAQAVKEAAQEMPARPEEKSDPAFDFGSMASGADETDSAVSAQETVAPKRREKPVRASGVRKAVSKTSAILASVIVVISIILTSVMAALAGGGLGGKTLETGMELSIKRGETKTIEFAPDYSGVYAIITENSMGLSGMDVREANDNLVVTPSPFPNGEYAYMLSSDRYGKEIDSNHSYRLIFTATGGDVKSEIRVTRVLLSLDDFTGVINGDSQASFLMPGGRFDTLKLIFNDNVTEVDVKDVLNDRSTHFRKSDFTSVRGYDNVLNIDGSLISGEVIMLTVKARGFFEMRFLDAIEESAEFGENIFTNDSSQHKYIKFRPTESGNYAFYTPSSLRLTVRDADKVYLANDRNGLVSYYLNSYNDYYIDVFSDDSYGGNGIVYKFAPSAIGTNYSTSDSYCGGVFTAPSDGAYRLAVDNSSVYKRVYDLASGNEVQGSNDGNNTVYNFTADKKYVIVIENYNDNYLEWSLTSAAPSAERLLPYQSPYISSSSPAIYSFTPSVNGQYRFFTNANFDTKLELYEGNRMIDSDDDGASNGSNALISRYLNAGTEYTLKVSPYGSSPSGNCPTYLAYPLADAGTTRVALSDGSYNYYAYSPPSGATYTVTASDPSASIRIYDSYAMSNAYSGTGSVDHAMSSGHTYIIGVSTRRSSCTVGISQSMTPALAASQSVSLSSSNGYMKEFSFAPSVSGTYKIFTAGSSSLYPRIYVYGSSGDLLTSDTTYAAGNYNAMVSYSFTAGREYTVKVNTNNYSGTTTLYCASQLTPDTAKSVTDTSGGNSYYWYAPSSAGSYTLAVSDSSASIYIYSNYSMGSSSTSGSGRVSYYMASSTNYIVKINNCYANGATVTITSDRVALAPSQSVTLGSANSYTKEFSFTPEASGTYKIFTAGNSSMYTRLYVYDGSGSPVASDTSYSAGNNNALVSYNFTAGRTYSVKVSTNNYSGTTTLYCAAPLTYGTAKSLSNTTGGDNVFWYSQSSYAARRISSSDFGAAISLYSGYGMSGYAAQGTGSVSYSMSSSYTYIVKVNSYTVGATVTVGAASNYSTLQPYQSPSISSSSPAYYSFTPNRSGTYKLFTAAAFDTKLTLYEGDGVTEIITDDDGAGNGNNALISRNFTAGTTYVLKVYPYSSSNSGTCPVYCAAPISSTPVNIDLANNSNYYWYTPSASGYKTINTLATSNISIYSGFGMSSLTSSSTGSLGYSYSSGNTYIIKVTTPYLGNTIRIS